MAFRHYKSGFLPQGGGIYDQPNRIMEMIETVEQAYNREIERRRKIR